MLWVKAFIEGLTTAGKNPYAFVAYVCLLAGFIFWLVSLDRLRAIGRLPAELQAPILAEHRVVGLTGDQWIHARRITLTFWAFVVLIVAIVLLGTIGILTLKPTSPIGTPTAENKPNSSTVVPPLDIPSSVAGGAPVGMEFKNRYLKNGTECIGETVKVSATDWEERVSASSPPACQDVTFKYTERESNDPQRILLYDESRNLFARLPNIPVGQTGPTDWRQPPTETWNAGRTLTRVD